MNRAEHPVPGRVAIESYRYALHAGLDARQRLHDGLAHLPALLPGCRHVTLSTLGLSPAEGGIASDDTAQRCEDLQHLLGQGPTVHALGTGHSVLSHDLRGETRWPRWRHHVVTELQVTAVLAFPLRFQARLVGALTLYSDRPGPLSDIDIALLHALAAPLSTVLAEARLDGHRSVQAA